MGNLTLNGASSGGITLQPAAVAGTNTITVPAITGTMSVQSAASFTQGSVIFAGASGVFSQNNSQLFWDNTNNRLGIGTASPSSTVHISAAGPVLRIADTTASGGVAFIGTDTTGLYFRTFTADTTRFLNSAGAQNLIIDASGNLGLGVTPSAWASPFTKAFEIGTVGSIATTTTSLRFANNAYYGSLGWTYKNTAAAAHYDIIDNAHSWYNAASGTAGTAITFTQAMTLDGSGNLGVGTASPSSYGKLAVYGASGGVSSRVISQGGTVSDYAQQILVAGSSLTHNINMLVYGDGSGNYHYSTAPFNFGTSSSNPLIFVSNSTERARFNAGAPILCLSGGNTSATGTGIAFPATQSASTDVNTLDDYEEGDWTPVYSGSSTGGSCTYGTRQGKYRKIGSYVYFQCYIITTSTHSGTGTLVVGGLPIAPLSGIYGGGATAVYKYQFVTNGPDFAQLEPSNSNLYLRKNNNTGQTDIAPSVLQNGTELMLFGCYIANT